MIHVWPSVSSVSRPCLYMLGSSSLTQVFRIYKTVLHLLYVNIGNITPVITWCLSMENCRNGAYSGRTIIPWNLVKGSSYNATTVLRKIRCIKINIMCNQNMWHDMAIIILCFRSPSPKHRHDLHYHRLDTLISIVASWSSRQLLLLQLSLMHSTTARRCGTTAPTAETRRSPFVLPRRAVEPP